MEASNNKERFINQTLKISEGGSTHLRKGRLITEAF